MRRAVRVAQRNALVYRHVWRGSLFSSFLQPALYLLAIGVGLGSMIDRGGEALPLGVSFLHFLAPGLLAAACMQTASFESTWPIGGKLYWKRTYDALTATPLSVRDVVLGELAWIGVRLSTVAATFTLVMTLFGVPRGRIALLAIPAAVLTGLAFSAPLMAYAAAMNMTGNFNAVFRFVITPLFLFSGVFFPVTRLPEPLQIAAWFTPLFHGVELVRGLTLDRLQSPSWIIHLTYLAAMLLIGYLAAVRIFERKLRP